LRRGLCKKGLERRFESFFRSFPSRAAVVSSLFDLRRRRLGPFFVPAPTPFFRFPLSLGFSFSLSPFLSFPEFH
jgi:hypothetical protein